jgi:hypothetical protein
MRSQRKISSEPAFCTALEKDVDYLRFIMVVRPDNTPPIEKRGREIGCSLKDSYQVECFWTGVNDKSKDYLQKVTMIDEA